MPASFPNPMSRPAPDPRPVALLGAGGHAAVVRETLRAAGRTFAGVYADEGAPALAPDAAALQPRLGSVESAFDSEVAGGPALFPAVGDNRLRLAWLERIAAARLAPAIVHPTAVIASDASIAPGVFIGPRAVVNARARLAAGAIVNTGAIVEHDCDVAEGAHLAPAATLAGGVRIERGVLIGAGAVCVPRVVVGAFTVVGANATVVRDLPPDVIAVGTPARPMQA